jgi:hypothetical protein
MARVRVETGWIRAETISPDLVTIKNVNTNADPHVNQFTDGQFP